MSPTGTFPRGSDRNAVTTAWKCPWYSSLTGRRNGASDVDGEVRHFTHPRLVTTSTHGTGCTLSAAVTAGLAVGRPLEVAVADALDFVHRAIARAPGLGAGHGPLDHTVTAPPPPPR